MSKTFFWLGFPSEYFFFVEKIVEVLIKKVLVENKIKNPS